MNANRRTSQSSKRRREPARSTEAQADGGVAILPWLTTSAAEAAAIEAAIERALDELEQSGEEEGFLPPAVAVAPPRLLGDVPQLRVDPAPIPERATAFAEGSQPNIAVSAFSADEEAFFAEGRVLCEQHAREADELVRLQTVAIVKQPWWRRLFGRSHGRQLAFD